MGTRTGKREKKRARSKAREGTDRIKLQLKGDICASVTEATFGKIRKRKGGQLVTGRKRKKKRKRHGPPINRVTSHPPCVGGKGEMSIFLRGRMQGGEIDKKKKKKL